MCQLLLLHGSHWVFVGVDCVLRYMWYVDSKLPKAQKHAAFRCVASIMNEPNGLETRGLESLRDPLRHQDTRSGTTPFGQQHMRRPDLLPRPRIRRREWQFHDGRPPWFLITTSLRTSAVSLLLLEQAAAVTLGLMGGRASKNDASVAAQAAVNNGNFQLAMHILHYPKRACI